MASQAVPLWECYEHTFSVKKRFGNPFLDVRLRITLTHDGRSYSIDGFYDGEESGASVFRFRFAPMQPGRWSFETSSNEPELHGVTGSFEAGKPISRGGLTTNSHFPNWFFRQDGGPEFVVNDGWTPHPGSTYGIEKYGPQVFEYPTEKQYQIFIDGLSRNGVNMTIDLRQLYARQDSITETSYLWPWEVVEPAKNRIDRDRFNLAYFQRLDRQLAYARSKGVFYGVELLYDNSTYRRAEWAHHPWNNRNGGWIEDWDGAPDDYTRDQLPFGWSVRRIFDLKNPVHVMYLKRYLAYAVSRMSAYWNVFYAVGCESSNIYPGIAERVDEWFTYWGDFIATKDPHGRLCSIGDVGARDRGLWHELTGNTAFVYQNARNNLITTQEHSLTDDMAEYAEAISRTGRTFWKFRRPTVIGEQDGRNNQKYDKERRGYWAAFVSGYMMGRIDRHYALSDGERFRESVLFGLEGDPKIYRYMHNLRRFVEDGEVPFWRLTPSDELLLKGSKGVFCLAEENEWYVIYFSAGGSTTVDLSDGSYEARWFDPRNGTFTGALQAVSGTAVEFAAPDDDDWTLLIRRSVNGFVGKKQ